MEIWLRDRGFAFSDRIIYNTQRTNWYYTNKF